MITLLIHTPRRTNRTMQTTTTNPTSIKQTAEKRICNSTKLLLLILFVCEVWEGGKI